MAIPDTNLVVCAYKKKGDTEPSFFSLPVKVYTDPQYEITGGDAALPKVLCSQGTVVANMPNDQTGTGGFCYLVNVTALAQMTTPKAKLNPTQLMSLIDGLKAPGAKPAKAAKAGKGGKGRDK